jgi:hypothetical protein
MMNAETQNALTTTTSNPIADGWDAQANDSAASPMKGGSIKFDNGAYFIGREKTLIQPDRQFVAIDVREGWLFLKKDCPAEYDMRAVGGPKPPRPSSYSDPSEWPNGLDGEPADPWKYAKFLYLLAPLSAEVFTFTSSTTGGRIGISDLTAQIQLMRNTRPGAVTDRRTPIAADENQIRHEAAPVLSGHGLARQIRRGDQADRRQRRQRR